MSLALILIAVACLAASGWPGLVMGARSRAGDVVSAVLSVAGGAVGLGGAAAYVMAPGDVQTLSFGWVVGRLAVGLDAVSVVFLLPTFVIAGLGAVYGVRYWPGSEHPGNGQRLRVSWGLLAAAMALVVLARDAVLFLTAWEGMALAAFVLIATEDHKAKVRQAAWVYLVATHVGTLCLFGLFALLRAETGSFALWGVLPASADLPVAGLFVLGMIGFGMKAGLFPLHVWLPGAHANAPSHVSAMLSGVMLKMGVYGLIRVMGLVAQPPIWWGAVVLGVGAVSALVGIAYAVGQADYKRLLAYSSIENVGIITMGLGLALLGESAGRREWVVLGLGAALLHVINHSLFKPLLFMGAGSLLHAVGTRKIDRLGGLARRMPVMFVLFVVGAVAICGLPPLNGFVSELLLYIGMLRTAQMPGGTAWSWAALGAPALALVGAMAVAGFVKLVGMVFLGEARSASAEHAHDPPVMMWGPVALLGLGCVMLGLFPVVMLPVVEPAIAGWSGAAGAGGGVALSAYAPFVWSIWAGVGLLGVIAVVLVMVLMALRGETPARTGTWDCGYVRPTARMQYTGTSFAEMLVGLGAWILWPRGKRPRLAGLFPRRSDYGQEVPDVVLEGVLTPSFSGVRWAAVWLRGIQHSSVRAYLIYVLLIVMLLVLLG